MQLFTKGEYIPDDHEINKLFQEMKEVQNLCLPCKQKFVTIESSSIIDGLNENFSFRKVLSCANSYIFLEKICNIVESDFVVYTYYQHVFKTKRRDCLQRFQVVKEGNVNFQWISWAIPLM